MKDQSEGYEHLGKKHKVIVDAQKRGYIGRALLEKEFKTWGDYKISKDCT